MKNKLVFVLTTALVVLIAFYLFNNIYKTLQSTFFTELTNSVIAMVFGGVVTVLLLYQQSAGEEKKERNIEIFKMKNELYNQLLDKMWTAWEDEIIEKHEIREILKILKRIYLLLDDKYSFELIQLVNTLIKLCDRNVDDENKLTNIEDIFLQMSAILKNDLGLNDNTISKSQYEKINDIEKENLLLSKNLLE